MTRGLYHGLEEAAAVRYVMCMGLRDRLLQRVRGVVDRFSGEHSAGSTSIRPDDAPAASPAPGAGDSDVKVTRARLKRPRDATNGG